MKDKQSKAKSTAIQPVVLDTHIWLWLLNREKQLQGTKALQLIEKAAQESLVFISAISLWEVAMLESKSRIELLPDCESWLNKALQAPGTDLIHLDTSIATKSTRLGEDFHGDPADRIITATAIIKNAILITRDSKILSYGKKHRLDILSA